MRCRPRSTRISTRPGRSVPTGRGSSCRTASARHSSTALTERTKSAVIGDPMDEATHIGPMVSERQRDIVLGFIAARARRRARGWFGGQSPPRSRLVHRAHDLRRCHRRHDHRAGRDLRARHVGAGFRDRGGGHRARQCHRVRPGRGVFTRDLARAHRVVRALRAGTCWINQYNLTPIEMPFGGVKASGIGRENARAAIEAYSQPKSVYVGLTPVEAPF
jgi:betaine-aldehyde dehydrogenase